MGVSSDGILCYGFRLTDEEGNEDDLDLPYLEDFDAFVLGMSSLKEPGDFDNDRFESDPEFKKAWQEHWAEKKAFFSVVGVALVYHCSYDEPMYILAASDSVISASRGYPIELGKCISAQKSSIWRSKLHTFCTRANIPFKAPQFILCSLYG